MRRGYRRMWLVVPCVSKKNLRSDSWKDIEEILKSKLSTINEEPESSSEECQTPPRLIRALAKSNNNNTKTKKKKGSKENKAKLGNFLLPHFSIKDSYALFVTRFVSKGSFGGLLQY